MENQNENEVAQTEEATEQTTDVVRTPPENAEQTAGYSYEPGSREAPARENEIRHIDAVEQTERTEKELEQIKLQSPFIRPSESFETFTSFTSGSNFMKALGKQVDSFTEKLTSIGSGLSNVAENIKAHIFGASEGFYNIDAYAANNQYFAISKKTILYQPTKLGVRWIDYARFLNDILPTIVTIERDVLAPVSEYLAQIINKPENLRSLNFKPKYKQKDIENIQKDMRKIFTGPMVEKVYWGVAFARNEDVKEFTRLMNQNIETCKGLKPETVKKSIDVISERARIVSKGLDDPNGKYDANPKSVEYIGEILYVAARYAELYSTVIQMVYEFEQCIVNSETALRNAK